MNFKGTHEIEFNNDENGNVNKCFNDVIGIIGQWFNDPNKSNESNKSAIIKAMIYNLYNYPTMNSTKFINNNTDEPMFTEMLWEFNNNDYLIKRGIDNKKNTIFEVSGYEEYPKNKMQEELNKIIGFDFKTFFVTSYFEQGDIFEILEASSSKKKELILNWLENNHWFDYEDKAKERLKLINNDIKENEGKLKLLQGFIIDPEIYNENIKLCNNKIARLIIKKSNLNKEFEDYKNKINLHNSTIEKSKQIILYNEQIIQFNENKKLLENDIINIKENQLKLINLNKELEKEKINLNNLIEKEKIEKEKIISDLMIKYNILQDKYNKILEDEKKELENEISNLTNKIDNEANKKYEEFVNQRNLISNNIEKLKTEKLNLAETYKKIQNLVKESKCPIADFDCPAVKNIDKVGPILKDVVSIIINNGKQKQNEINDLDIKINVIQDKLIVLKNIINNNNIIQQEIYNIKSKFIKSSKSIEISKEIEDCNIKISNIKITNLKQVDIEKSKIQIRELETKINSLNDIKSEEIIKKEIENYNEKINQCKNIIVELNDFVKNNLINNIEDINLKYNNINEEKQKIENELIDINKEKHGYEIDIKSFEENKININQIEEELKKYKKNEGYLNFIKYAFGKNGIPAYTINNAMIEVEEETNDILRKLNTNKKIEFIIDRDTDSWESNCLICNTPFEKGERTHTCKNCNAAREKKKKDVFDIVIYENDKEMDFKSLSGGARILLAFAVRLSLSNLIMKRKGIENGILILDESFVFLDKSGLNEIIKTITKTLKNDFNFKQIFIISHLKEIKDCINNNLLVTRYDDHSEVKWIN